MTTRPPSRSPLPTKPKAGRARRPVGRPPRHVAEAIDTQLLDAARALFCDKGIAGTTMEEIADHTGIAKQTIYRRYPGKAALIDAVVARDLDHMTTPISLAGAPAIERLRLTTHHRFRFSLDTKNLLFVNFLMAEAAFSPELRQRFREWSVRIHRPVMELIREAQNEHDLRPSDPATTSRLLDDLMNSPAQRLRLEHPDAFDNLTSEQWFDARWQAFLILERPQR